MGAIYKREVKAYFTSPLAYVFLCVSVLVSSFFFVMGPIWSQTSDMTNYFGNWVFVFLIFIPLLTMRLMSEERKLKTDQILITSPVSISHIILAKFFAAMTVVLSVIGLTLIHVVFVAIFGQVQWGSVITMYIGILLVTGVMVAIGIFISSITESQVIAAVITMGVFFLLWTISWATAVVNNGLILQAINYISLTIMLDDFASGLLNIAPVLYLLSLIIIFLFLTVRTVEKRRWS